VVAKVRKGAKLRHARKAVKRGGCAVRTKTVRSRVRKGRVVRLSHKAGKRLAGGARVTIYVSRGRR
jgi:beta-lactam-binding protein with PASTA domain